MKFIVANAEDKARLGRELQTLMNDGLVLSVEVSEYEPHRTPPQNDHIHPLVRQIKSHLEASGATQRHETWWRNYLVAEYAGQEVIPSRTNPGNFLVMNKQGTSSMSKSEASDFLEWLYAFGTDIGVEWEAA